MIPTSLPAAVLPRARCLTDALIAPPDPAPAGATLEVLRARIRDELAVVAPLAGPVLRVDGYLLRVSARGPERPPTADRPFSWSPRTARRSIGVAAVRCCLEGDARTPAEAVVATAARMAEDARAGLARRASPASWLATLEDGARAAVLAEATTWATHLFEAVEWRRLDPPPAVGCADRWWDCPGVPTVALRGRADVRVGAPADRQVLLAVAAGRPGPTSRVELALAALVDVAARPSTPPPARVVGWWPECGRALVLSVDLELLEETARSVVAAVCRAAQARAQDADIGDRRDLSTAA